MKETSRIPLSAPHFGKEFRASDFSADPQEALSDFEQQVLAYMRVPYGVALQSGTAAIHLALKSLGVGAGDLVLCQSFTYAATAFPIVYQGATPVFIDSEPDTWNMDPELLAQALAALKAESKKVKGIIPVHLYGMPAKMRELKAIADQYKIPVIEDAAEALGSSYYGDMCGSLGEVNVLSFNSNKIITSSGGGMLLSQDAEKVARARYWSTQAKEPGDHFEHLEIGYNYRMNHLNALIGSRQFQMLTERVEARRANFDWYKELFNPIEGVSFVEEPAGIVANRWLTTLLIDSAKSGGVSRDDLQLAFHEANIEARPVWKPMHLQPVFKDALAFTNGVSERLFEQGLCLPSGSNLTDEQRERIAEVVWGVFRG